MTVTAYPFVGQKTKDTQWQALARKAQPSGVLGVPGDSSLRPSANATGMKVTLEKGAVVDEGFVVEADATVNLTVEAASPQARIDMVAARVYATATSGVRGEFVVIKGTPAATPTVPALSRGESGAWDYPLALVAVPAGAVTIPASAVTDVRTWVVRSGGAWTAMARPAVTELGDFGINWDTKELEFYGPGGWAPIAVPAHNADRVTSGVLDPERIPTLQASKVDGALSAAQVPSLDASKIGTGKLAVDRIPNLPADRITSGKLAGARLPNLNAALLPIAMGTSSATTGANGRATVPLSLPFVVRQVLVNLGPGTGDAARQPCTVSTVSVSASSFVFQLNDVRMDTRVLPYQLVAVTWVAYGAFLNPE